MLRKLLVMAIGGAVAAGCGMVTVVSHVSSGGVDGKQVKGSGKATSVTRQIGSFKSVELDGAMNANITVGAKSGLKITGDDNIIPLVKTEIKGDVLRIYTDTSYSTDNSLNVTFSVPELTGAAINGAGDITIHSFKGKDLNLAVRGSGDVVADGRADSLLATIQGSGNLDLFKLPASNVQVSIHGSGNADVTATSSLQAAIAGSGDIRYKGKPQTVNPAVTGSGDIRAAD